MIKDYAQSLQDAGWLPIPLEWDAEAKQGKPCIAHHNLRPGDAIDWPEITNGLALKLFPPFFMVDIDLKNTDRKGIYSEWLQALPDSILSKVCVEQTRNGGYHIYGNCPHVQRKLVLAKSTSGAEVISIYSGSVLSFCWPTPGYTIVHNDMESIDELTADEYDHIVSLSASFNDYTERTTQAKVCISYPERLADFCKSFDQRLTDEAFETMLNEMTLYQVQNYRYRAKDKFTAYLRTGSTAAFSAKVYHRSRKVLLFTASLPGYPTHADHNPERPGEWILTPTKIIYYQCQGDWQATQEHIQAISNSIGIELEPAADEPAERTFPLHVFPEYLQQAIQSVAEQRSLPPQFVAASCLWAVSALAGNTFYNIHLPQTENILYILLIAPVSVGKTPAVKTSVFDPLKRIAHQDEQQYKQLLDAWQAKRTEAANKRKAFNEPRPKRYLPLLTDGTTESFVSIHMDQPNGIGVFYDEAETIFNAGNYKQINDAITFYTTAFNGGALNITRADREKERVVPDVNINLIAGTQPERLSIIFTEDKIQAGFPARFLMVYSDYKQLNEESDPFSQGARMPQQWADLLTILYNRGKQHNIDGHTVGIEMDEAAIDSYRKYHRSGLAAANQRINEREHPTLIGLGAKMSAYLMRLTNVLSIIHNCDTPIITGEIMQYGYDLYQYFYETTAELLMNSQNEVDTGLPRDLQRLYDALPNDKFSAAQAKDICKELGLNDRKFDRSIGSKKFKHLFKRLGHGMYIKAF